MSTQTYGRKAWTVVGYTYQAEILCPECAVSALTRARGAYPANPQEAMRKLAKRDRIDTSDESSYDSDEFPKVVFSSDIEGSESCGSCGGELS